MIMFHFKREPALRIREPDEKREGAEHNWEIDAYLMAGKQRPGVRPRGNHCIIDNRMDTESTRCPGARIKKMPVQTLSTRQPPPRQVSHTGLQKMTGVETQRMQSCARSWINSTEPPRSIVITL